MHAGKTFQLVLRRGNMRTQSVRRRARSLRQRVRARGGRASAETPAKILLAAGEADLQSLCSDLEELNAEGIAALSGMVTGDNVEIIIEDPGEAEDETSMDVDHGGSASAEPVAASASASSAGSSLTYNVCINDNTMVDEDDDRCY